MARTADPGTPDGHAAGAGLPLTADSDPALQALLERLAHDLRGPLSPLQTAVYLLRRDDTGVERKAELLDIIDRQTVRLGSMVQEMSDWMRAQQSRLVGHRDAMSVPMLVELGCAEFAAGGGAVDLPESLDETNVLGDAQNLVKLLATMIAYARSQAGDTPVSVSAQHAGDDVLITVEHGGLPLPEAMLATLFSAPEPSPFDEGLGLRLVVAQAIAQGHGGSLSIHVTEMGTSQLCLRIPVMQLRR